MPRMGTTFHLVLYGSERGAAEGAAEAAFDELVRLDGILSDYDPASELSALSRTSREPLPSAWTDLSPELSAVLSRAREIAACSEGAFDVTCGAATRLWRRAIREGELPEESEIQRARADWRALELSADGGRARWLRSGLRLDLGGIAKGFTLDRMLLVLERRGFPRALVIGGGDVVAGLAPPGRKAWRIRLAPPTPPRAAGDGSGVGAPEVGRDAQSLGAAPDGLALGPGVEQPRWIELTRGAVATSGDLYRAVELGGVRHSHIVDPRTGRALVTRAGASVLAADAMTADGLATAATVLGPESCARLLPCFPGVALRVVADGPDAPRSFETPGFPARALR